MSYDRMNSEEVLNGVKENRPLLDTIYKEDGGLVGHIIRGKGIISIVLKGSVEGKRRRKGRG